MKNTLEQLNSKAWYRLLKVLYIFIFVITIISSFFVFTEDGFEEGIAMLIIALIIFEFIRRAFYYVVLGDTQIKTSRSYGFIKKSFIVMLAIMLGSLGWAVVKYSLLFLGPFILISLGISGEEVARDLEATAEILGLVVFAIIVNKTYKKIVYKNFHDKTDNQVGIAEKENSKLPISQ